MYKLKTLDVWDTLLRRKCHPDFIKLTAARHLQLRFAGRLAECCCRPKTDHQSG